MTDAAKPSWWEETKDMLTLKCEVFQPPCRWCQHFRPQLNEGPNGHGGFRLCHAADQFQDFSCFTPKDDHGK